jgi:hypothetical protein
LTDSLQNTPILTPHHNNPPCLTPQHNNAQKKLFPPTSKTSKSPNESDLTIIQININGINNKIHELQILAKDTNADILIIQET